jgi:hypothetical protein
LENKIQLKKRKNMCTLFPGNTKQRGFLGMVTGQMLTSHGSTAEPLAGSKTCSTTQSRILRSSRKPQDGLRSTTCPSAATKTRYWPDRPTQIAERVRWPPAR